MLYKKINNFSPYSNRICRKAVSFVFDSLRFDDPHLWFVMRDSYLLNIGLLRQYARDNNIDEMSYILGIRDNLLTMNGVHSR